MCPHLIESINSKTTIIYRLKHLHKDFKNGRLTTSVLRYEKNNNSFIQIPNLNRECNVIRNLLIRILYSKIKNTILCRLSQYRKGDFASRIIELSLSIKTWDSTIAEGLLENTIDATVEIFCHNNLLRAVKNWHVRVTCADPGSSRGSHEWIRYIDYGQ